MTTDDPCENQWTVKGLFFADFFSKPLRLVEPRLQNFTTEDTLFLLSIPCLLLFGLYFGEYLLEFSSKIL